LGENHACELKKQNRLKNYARSTGLSRNTYMYMTIQHSNNMKNTGNNP